MHQPIHTTPPRRTHEPVGPPGSAADERAADESGRGSVALAARRPEPAAFLSILSHELRTPITTIYAGSRVLARHGGTNARASAEIAADISAEAAHLYDVVEDMLVLSRAENGVLELSDEPVHLQRLVEGAVRIAAGRAPDAPISFEGTSDPPAVRGDAGYVEQVVRNLITVAIRSASPGMPVAVRLEARDTAVAVAVLDRGPDPSDEELAQAWDLHDATGGTIRSGHGIGLYVCRLLVEAMRGHVWIARRPGGGAEVGFELPRYATD
jgi:signal transduction histidine kinase